MRAEPSVSRGSAAASVSADSRGEASPGADVGRVGPVPLHSDVSGVGLVPMQMCPGAGGGRGADVALLLAQTCAAVQLWGESRRGCGRVLAQELTTDRSLKCGSSGALWFLHLVGERRLRR